MDHQRSLKIGLSSAIFLLAIQPRAAAQTTVNHNLEVSPETPIKQNLAQSLTSISSSSDLAQTQPIPPEPLEGDIRFSKPSDAFARINPPRGIDAASLKWDRPAPMPDLRPPTAPPNLPQAQPVFPEPLEAGVRFSGHSQNTTQTGVSKPEAPRLAWVRPAAPIHTQRPFLSPPDLPQVQPIFPELLAPNVRLVIDLSERTVYVYQDNKLMSSYPVAIGRPGWETPIGEYHVMSMLQNPGWTHPLTGEVVPPGPDNPLGERWIAFWTDGDNYIGFHGTPNRESIGNAASHGCVRMFNEDVRELYEMVQPGTTVVVEP